MKSINNTGKDIFLYFRGLENLGIFFRNQENKLLQEKIKGIYFGEEFCEYMIPSLEEVKKAYQICKINNKCLYFLTTPATNKTLEAYKRIFCFLNNKKKIKIVINDWGILNLLNERYQYLEPVLGRLLNKNKRFIYKAYTPDLEGIDKSRINKIIRNQLATMRDINFSVKEFVLFLKGYRIKEVDMDIPPQGITLNKIINIDFGFYYPWGYLTKTRLCASNPSSSISITTKPCSNKRCLKISRRISRKKFNLNTDLLNIGNTLFYAIKNCNSSANFQRIIYEADFTENALLPYPNISIRQR